MLNFDLGCPSPNLKVCILAYLVLNCVFTYSLNIIRKLNFVQDVRYNHFAVTWWFICYTHLEVKGNNQSTCSFCNRYLQHVFSDYSILHHKHVILHHFVDMVEYYMNLIANAPLANLGLSTWRAPIIWSNINHISVYQIRADTYYEEPTENRHACHS